jgi:hypothetical protein
MQLVSLISEDVIKKLGTEVDLRDYGVSDAADLEVAILVFKRSGESAFITTLPTREDLAELLQEWVDNVG